MPKKRPATTPEAREQQLIGLAADLAERQMRAGKASPSVIVHFLKLGTEREKLERTKLEHENALLVAKTDATNSAAHIEELYEKAISAMRSYASPCVGEDQDKGDVM